jgi:hypothetical protein
MPGKGPPRQDLNLRICMMSLGTIRLSASRKHYPYSLQVDGACFRSTTGYEPIFQANGLSKARTNIL